MTKNCSGCDRDLSLDAFNRSKRSRDGLQVRCRSCQAKARRDRDLRLKDETRERITSAPAEPGINETGALKTIARMTADHELRDVDSDRVAALISLAKAVDADTGNAALWSQYRGAMKEIRQRTREDVAAAKRASSEALIARVRGTGPRRPVARSPSTPQLSAPPRAKRRAEPADPTVLPPERT